MNNTNCVQPILTAPIKFLGATVLSFSSSLGLGSQESSISVDLVEDCDETAPDNFLPKSGSVIVGDPVFFPSFAPANFKYTFGGVLTNWTMNQNSGGLVYNVKVTDPRQLLENVAVVVDGSLMPPIQANNYINVYAAYEGSVAGGNCNNFGSSLSNERGMPYSYIVDKLIQMNPVIKSPTGAVYSLNWADFPPAPSYYRVAGPQTVLQLLQDVCDVRGLEFYVYLQLPNIIRIGTIDLKIQPTSFGNIIAAFDGSATDLSYGQELRNERTKSILFGEQVHYLTYVDCFNHFFGEEQNLNTGEMQPVVPIAVNDDGTNFVIEKRITELNLGLYEPIDGDGPYRISEIQIRAAMASREAWERIVMDKDLENNPNDLATKIRNKFAGQDANLKEAIEGVFNSNQLHPEHKYEELMRIRFNANSAAAKRGKFKSDEDLNKIHEFVANLGNTFYGKQFIAKLNEKICYFKDPEHPFGEKIFSSIPTNAGGWYQEGGPVLGLSDPDLGVFRSEDNRVVCFGVFNIEGSSEEPEDDGQPDEVNPPSGGGGSSETENPPG